MKYLIVVNIKEGRFTRQHTFEKENYDEVLKSINEFPYNWELLKVYEISREVSLDIIGC